MKAERKSLRKSSTNSMISGVAGGMADYFDLDPTLVRVGWVVLCFASLGTAIVAYIAMAVLVPSDDSCTPDAAEFVIDDSNLHLEKAGRENRHYFLASVLIGLGLVFLASNFGLLAWWSWDMLWPIVLIAIGGSILLVRYRKRD